MGLNALIVAFLLITAGMLFHGAVKAARVQGGWPAAAAMLVLGGGIVAIALSGS